jgi:hypothetical protein
LLPGGTLLNLKGNSIKPLSQLAIADELSALISAMDEEDVCPTFDAHNQVFGNFQQLGDASEGDAEFLSRLEAAE